MLRFTIRRLLELIPVLLAVVTVTFFLIRLAPGGPFTAERNYPEEAIQRMNEFYGLDDPLPIQYLNYLASAIRGDLGPSIHNSTRTVNDIIAQNFPVSLELGLYAMVFALLFGLATGLSAALRHNQWWDHLVMPVAMTGICVPSFVIGPVLALVFGLHYGWFNVAGWEEPSDRVLPAITLGLGVAAYIARLSRGSMLEVLPQDYIRTARAKGLNESQVLIRHTLKNAMIPVVSFLGPAAAGIITGSFVVETIFQIPGLGRMFVMSAFNRDYPLILGLVAFYAVIVVLFNLLVDLCIAWLNPRTRTHTVA
jgi:oligopeptide transport system permease protein